MALYQEHCRFLQTELGTGTAAQIRATGAPRVSRHEVSSYWTKVLWTKGLDWITLYFRGGLSPRPVARYKPMLATASLNVQRDLLKRLESRHFRDGSQRQHPVDRVLGGNDGRAL